MLCVCVTLWEVLYDMSNPHTQVLQTYALPALLFLIVLSNLEYVVLRRSIKERNKYCTIAGEVEMSVMREGSQPPVPQEPHGSLIDDSPITSLGGPSEDPPYSVPTELADSPALDVPPAADEVAPPGEWSDAPSTRIDTRLHQRVEDMLKRRLAMGQEGSPVGEADPVDEGLSSLRDTPIEVGVPRGEAEKGEADPIEEQLSSPRDTPTEAGVPSSPASPQGEGEEGQTYDPTRIVDI